MKYESHNSLIESFHGWHLGGFGRGVLYLNKVETMTFSQWQEFARTVRERGERIDRMRIDRAKRIAISAGISPDGCCIHNASIAKIGEGWGAGPKGRQIIKAARRANRLWNDFSGSTLASRIVRRAWETVVR